MKKQRKPLENLTGRRFGRLFVLGLASKEKQINNCRWWECQCECGKITVTKTKYLNNGDTKSCGCWNIAAIVNRNTSHNLSKIPEYRLWKGIIKRCENPNNFFTRRYIERGIKICNGFRCDFLAFYIFMGNRPSKQHTIDRINNNGHYSCGHCDECLEKRWAPNLRWATWITQNRNKGSNRWLECLGKKMILEDWASELKVNSGLLCTRLKRSGSLLSIIIKFHLEYYNKQTCPPPPHNYRSYNSHNLIAA